MPDAIGFISQTNELATLMFMVQLESTQGNRPMPGNTTKGI